MEDQEIVNLYWLRDEAALKETDNKYHGILFSLSRSIVMDDRLSEECLNDTYLRAWNSIPPHRPKFLGAFLSRIIRHISIDVYRSLHRGKRGGKMADLVFEELEECLSSPESVQDSLDAKLLGEEISRFLRKYSERDRALFLRRYFWQDSLKEAASSCGVSEANAKVILFRMRAALKKHLEERGYEI